MHRAVAQTHCSMIGVIILCLPQTHISPGRTTGISFLCAHTRAHTYGRFTRFVPLGLPSPLHGGLLRLMRKTSKHAPSVLEHANAVTQTWWYFGYEMTRKHSKKKKRKKKLTGSEFSRHERSRCLWPVATAPLSFQVHQTGFCCVFVERLRRQMY